LVADTPAWIRDLHLAVCTRRNCQGRSEIAKKRLEAVKGIPLLEITEEVLGLATALVASRIIPRRAGTDAAHIALATVHGLDFLLTWNCTHLANGAIIRGIERVCRKRGLECPVICTPEELMEGMP
jgi:hypothetical protein